MISFPNIFTVFLAFKFYFVAWAYIDFQSKINTLHCQNLKYSQSICHFLHPSNICTFLICSYCLIPSFSTFFNSGATLTLRIFPRPTLQKVYENDLTSNRDSNWSFCPTVSLPLTSYQFTPYQFVSPPDWKWFCSQVPPSMEFLSTVSHQTIAEMLMEMYFRRQNGWKTSWLCML